MIAFIKKWLGLSAPVDFKTLVRNGAQIIDVRTTGEFQSGHISGSVNIPLQVLSGQLSKINRDRPVITCCASGMRSSSAKSILKTNGFSDVYNGGSWNSLEKKIT